MPPFGDAVALILRTNIKAADHRDLFVANDAFPMIAKTKPLEFERIEPAKLPARAFQRVKKLFLQRHRPKRIDHDAHIDAAPTGPYQRIEKALPIFAVSPNVKFDPDRFARGVNHRKTSLQRLIDRGQKPKSRRFGTAAFFWKWRCGNQVFLLKYAIGAPKRQMFP